MEFYENSKFDDELQKISFRLLKLMLIFQENLSVKIQPTLPEKLEKVQGAMGPNDKDLMAQLNAAHPLAVTEAKVSFVKFQNELKINYKSTLLFQYDQHQLTMNSHMILSHQGIGAQLKYLMEVRSAGKVGRLPFLPSSNISRDVLLGLDESISPSDVFGTSEFSEQMYQPHAVVEKKLGIF